MPYKHCVVLHAVSVTNMMCPWRKELLSGLIMEKNAEKCECRKAEKSVAKRRQINRMADFKVDCGPS